MEDAGEGGPHCVVGRAAEWAGGEEGEVCEGVVKVRGEGMFF